MHSGTAMVGFIATPQELKAMKTKFVNLHDQLLANLDHSGGNLPIGGVERRLKCWNSFVGESGRSKNVALFYCFVLWEGCELRWASRVAPASAQRSSVDGPPAESPTTGGLLSKKQMQQVQMMQQVIGTPSSGGWIFCIQALYA